MGKALLFADLHLHSHKESIDRLHHCLEVLRWVFEQATEHQVDHILFLGDLLHERSKIDVMNYLRMFETFMNYMITKKANYDIYLLIGNHDMYHKEKWDVNSVKPLTAIPRVNVVAEPCTINIGGLDIDFCPHTENPLKELNKLKNGRRKLLLGHMAVHGAKLNKLYGTKSDVIVEYDNDMTVVGVDIFNAWDQVFLGHYHGAQQLSATVEYIGSPLQLSFGEAFEKKHIIILDLETQEKTYIENSFSPQHLIISPDDIVNYNLDDNFVRVVVEDLNAKALIDLKRNIHQNFKVASLDFKQKDKKVEEDRVVVEGAKAMLYNEDEMFDRYIKNRGAGGLDEAQLKKVVKLICQKTKSKN